jgi:anti-anti-sigma factor
MDRAGPIEVTIETEGRSTRFRLRGELDITAADGLAEIVREVPDDCRQVVLDLSGVTFLDSSGIAFLVRERRSHQQAGRECSVVGTQGQPARVLELAGLDDLVRLVERYG